MSTLVLVFFLVAVEPNLPTDWGTTAGSALPGSCLAEMGQVIKDTSVVLVQYNTTVADYTSGRISASVALQQLSHEDDTAKALRDRIRLLVWPCAAFQELSDNLEGALTNPRSAIQSTTAYVGQGDAQSFGVARAFEDAVVADFERASSLYGGLTQTVPRC